MKIIYLVHQFYPMYYSGTEKFVLNLSAMMQKAGNKVKVLSYSFHDDSFYDRTVGSVLLTEYTYKTIPVVTFRHKKIPADVHYSLREDAAFSEIAATVMGAEKPDIVHVGHPMRTSEFINAAHLLGVPYIMAVTDFFLICPKIILSTARGNLCAGPEGGKACNNLCPGLSPYQTTDRFGRAKDILLNATRVIAPSQFVASIFKKEFEHLDVKVIHHGISYSSIKKNNNIYVQGDKLTFCYAGTLASHKGVHVLVDAFKQVKSDAAVLKIYGSGPDTLYVNQLMNSAKNDKRIEFCGVFSEEQIGDIFSKTDIVIVPSLCFESYSFVLHEALACYVPVIASHAGGLSEKIKDGVNGFAFRMGDVEHLREILERIINKPEEINVLKDNIRKQIIPTVEQEAYAYERIYRRVLNERKGNNG